MRNKSVKLFRNWASVSGGVSFKDISYLEPCQSLCSMEGNHLCNFGRVHYEEQFCVIVFNLDQRFRRRCHLKTSLSRALATALFSRLEPFEQFW